MRANGASDSVCDAKRRLLSVNGDPFVFADWERLVFLHFVIAPELLRPHVPQPFELELHEASAVVSVVAVTIAALPAEWALVEQLSAPAHRAPTIPESSHLR